MRLAAAAASGKPRAQATRGSEGASERSKRRLELWRIEGTRRRLMWPVVGCGVTASVRDHRGTRKRKTLVARLGDLARGRVDY